MEENRTDISKSNEDISCIPCKQGNEDRDTTPLPSPRNESESEEPEQQPSSSPEDQESATAARPLTITPDEADTLPPSPPPGTSTGEEDTEAGADLEQNIVHPPHSSKPAAYIPEEEEPYTPPEHVPAPSTQMIFGFDPAQPVLMPGRPVLSPEDEERINKYRKFQKVDGAAYRRVNQFLRKHTYVTAREWAIARLCADFSTRGGAEMTFIGENLPDLVPFMTDTYSPQAVNQARSSFKKKVRKSGATFFYGALCGFFTADELDDILFEASEVARFLLEVEGTSIDIDDEIDIEDRITEVMRGVAEAASRIRSESPDLGNDEPYETEDDDL